jgi:hypothetical protein
MQIEHIIQRARKEYVNSGLAVFCGHFFHVGPHQFLQDRGALLYQSQRVRLAIGLDDARADLNIVPQ